jgi:hypothetical protein
MKLHKQIIQDLIDPLTKNHVDRTIKTRVILNLGVHTFTDREVQSHLNHRSAPTEVSKPGLRRGFRIV